MKQGTGVFTRQRPRARKRHSHVIGIAALVKTGATNLGWITLDDVTGTLIGARG